MWKDAIGLLMVAQGLNPDGSYERLDGGDSAANTARYVFMVGGLNNVRLLNAFVKGPGIIRSPTDTNWNKLEQTSRDQVQPLVMASLSVRLHVRNEYFSRVNKDIVTPWFFPSLLGHRPSQYLQDAQDLLSVLVRSVASWVNRDDVGDDLNLTVSLIHAARSRETTLFNSAARWLYPKLKRSPFSPDESIKNPVARAWAWYYRRETGNNYEIAEAARPVIERYIP